MNCFCFGVGSSNERTSKWLWPSGKSESFKSDQEWVVSHSCGFRKNLFVLQSIVSKGCLIPNFVYEFFLIAVDEKIMVTFDFIRFSEPFFRLSIYPCILVLKLYILRTGVNQSEKWIKFNVNFRFCQRYFYF